MAVPIEPTSRYPPTLVRIPRPILIRFFIARPPRGAVRQRPFGAAVLRERPGYARLAAHVPGRLRRTARPREHRVHPHLCARDGRRARRGGGRRECSPSPPTPCARHRERTKRAPCALLRARRRCARPPA